MFSMYVNYSTCYLSLFPANPNTNTIPKQTINPNVIILSPHKFYYLYIRQLRRGKCFTFFKFFLQNYIFVTLLKYSIILLDKIYNQFHESRKEGVYKIVYYLVYALLIYKNALTLLILLK